MAVSELPAMADRRAHLLHPSPSATPPGAEHPTTHHGRIQLPRLRTEIPKTAILIVANSKNSCRQAGSPPCGSRGRSGCRWGACAWSPLRPAGPRPCASSVLLRRCRPIMHPLSGIHPSSTRCLPVVRGRLDGFTLRRPTQQDASVRALPRPAGTVVPRRPLGPCPRARWLFGEHVRAEVHLVGDREEAVDSLRGGPPERSKGTAMISGGRWFIGVFHAMNGMEPH